MAESALDAKVNYSEMCEVYIIYIKYNKNCN